MIVFSFFLNVEFSCEEEVNEEYNFLVENSDFLYLGGNQFEVIFFMNVENVGYKYKE